MSFLNRVRRPWCALAIAALGALYLVGLGGPGLWDPLELDAVDRVLGHAPARGPMLDAWLPSAGFALFGINELGARAPQALLALAAIWLTWWWARSVAGPRVGAIAAVLTACAPLVLLEGRVLGGAIGALLGNTAAIAGATLVLERRVRTGIGWAIAGGALGYVASGAVIGIAVPAAALAIAGASSGTRRLVWVGGGIAAVAMAAAALGALSPGAAAHAAPRELAWDTAVERIAYGCFPWIALVPAALAARERLDRSMWLALGWAVAAFVACSALSLAVGPTPYPAMPALALLAAGWIDAVTSRRHAPSPGALAIGVLGVVLLARDLAAHPGRLATLHAADTHAVGYDGASWLRAVPLLVGAAFAVAFLGAALGRGRVRRWAVVALPGSCAALGLIIALAWLPSISRGLSTKHLFDRYRAHAGPADTLAVMSVPDRLTRLYAARSERVGSVELTVGALDGDARRFAMIPARAICETSQLARRQGLPFYVLDRSDSFALVSNAHEPGEALRGGLDDAIRSTAPVARTALGATFADGLELIGADLPARVSRGDRFEVTLYFRVVRPPTKRWQVFAHFDRGGLRFQGDHWPVGDRCPTQRWNAGDYVADRFTVTAGDVTYPTGAYRMWAGFFVGGGGAWTNMEVTGGSATADPQHRVLIGTVEVE